MAESDGPDLSSPDLNLADLIKIVNKMNDTIYTAEDDTVKLKTNLDNFFLIVMGCIVFLMQAGFAFLEAGAVRSKNTVNILIKNMLDALIGGVSYWAIGMSKKKTQSLTRNFNFLAIWH